MHQASNSRVLRSAVASIDISEAEFGEESLYFRTHISRDVPHGLFDSLAVKPALYGLSFLVAIFFRNGSLSLQRQSDALLLKDFIDGI